MITIVIVGSEQQYWTPNQEIVAKKIIEEIVKVFKYSLSGKNNFLTGGCPHGGVDKWSRFPM